MIHDEGTLEPDDREFTLSRLQDLAKQAQVFPKYHELQEIHVSGDVISGGAFSDVYKETYKGQTLAIKIVRSFSKKENKHMLRVSLETA